MTANEFRRRMAKLFKGKSHAEIGKQLGLSAGFVGMVLKGSREPSKKFLDAVGFERISSYRPKAKP